MWDALTTPVPLLLTLIGARIAPISYEKTSNMSGKGNMVIRGDHLFFWVHVSVFS